MKKIIILPAVLIWGLFLMDCSKTRMVQPAPDQRSSTVQRETAISKETAPEEQTPFGGIKDENIKESVITTDGTRREDKTVFELKDIPFDYDRYNLRAEARKLLDDAAEWLGRNKDINIVIEGHCDERGTNEYNLALGEKRAKTVKDYLASSGIKTSRMTISTYGEEKPICSEQNEVCYQKNRRAHFVVTQ